MYLYLKLIAKSRRRRNLAHLSPHLLMLVLSHINGLHCLLFEELGEKEKWFEAATYFASVLLQRNDPPFWILHFKRIEVFDFRF